MIKERNRDCVEAAKRTGRVRLSDITLRCPTCKRTMKVKRYSADPRRATVLEVECPACEPDTGKFEQANYFDACGKPIH